MATPNYSYEKRQRELAKKRKNEEKRQRKANTRPDGSPAEPDAAEPHADGTVSSDTPPPEGQA